MVKKEIHSDNHAPDLFMRVFAYKCVIQHTGPIDIVGIFRTVYLATRPEAVYVLHCFQKKTQQTAPHDIELARKRLKNILR